MYSFPNFEPVSCSISDSNCVFLNCILVSQEIGKLLCPLTLCVSKHNSEYIKKKCKNSAWHTDTVDFPPCFSVWSQNFRLILLVIIESSLVLTFLKVLSSPGIYIFTGSTCSDWFSNFWDKDQHLILPIRSFHSPEERMSAWKVKGKGVHQVFKKLWHYFQREKDILPRLA